MQSELQEGKKVNYQLQHQKEQASLNERIDTLQRENSKLRAQEQMHQKNTDLRSVEWQQGVLQREAENKKLVA